MSSRMVTRVLAVLFMGVFVFSVWSCGYSQDVSKSSELDPTVHDKGYENTWVLKVEPATSLVEVVTVDSKIKFSFRTSTEHLNRFHKGWIAPLTLNCEKVGSECDFTRPYVLYVGSRKVELIKAVKN